jgi:hypothetical protein
LLVKQNTALAAEFDYYVSFTLAMRLKNNFLSGPFYLTQGAKQ